MFFFVVLDAGNNDVVCIPFIFILDVRNSVIIFVDVVFDVILDVVINDVEGGG